MGRGQRQSIAASGLSLDQLLDECASTQRPPWMRPRRYAAEQRPYLVELTPDSTPEQWWQSLHRRQLVRIPDPERKQVLETSLQGAALLDLLTDASALGIDSAQLSGSQPNEMADVFLLDETIQLDYYTATMFVPMSLPLSAVRSEFVERYTGASPLDYDAIVASIRCDEDGLVVRDGGDQSRHYPVTSRQLAHMIELMRHEQLTLVMTCHRDAEGLRDAQISRGDEGGLLLLARREGSPTLVADLFEPDIRAFLAANVQ